MRAAAVIMLILTAACENAVDVRGDPLPSVRWEHHFQSTGGGGAHNNLQPYIVVYMWKRTA